MLRLFVLAIIVNLNWIEAKKCVQWSPKLVKPDDPAMVYSETASEVAGIGSHLSVFAMLWTLRRSYNVDVFISKSCYDKLVTVFTPESIDIPVLEQYFCNPEQIKFSFFSGTFDEFVNNRGNR